MFVLEHLREYAKTNRTALINREERLSFAQLDAWSEAFAAWLLERFGADRSPVVIYGHKETAFLPCMFGALKAGRAYVPVDSVVPPGRAAEIIAEVSPRAVVNLSGLALPPAGAQLLDAAALEAVLRAPLRGRVPGESRVAGDATAYILFTSGSTGRPKGVPITAGNLENFHRGFAPWLPEEGGAILNQVSYSFDVSCCSVYTGLSRGMTMFTVDNGMTEDMAGLYARLGQSGLATWVSTPSFAELCVRSRIFEAGLLPKLRRFVFCGEVLTHKLCDQLAERFPEARIINTYGPTEATVLVTAAEVTEEMRRDPRPIPIGRPLAEVGLRLAGGEGSEAAAAEGELLILSDSVGPGYLGRPQLTAERFFRDEATGKRGYRTGDLCRRENGLYYYQGRADNQLKLSGHRIELEDIESNLARLENIARAAVVPVWEGQRVRYLAAFLLLEREDGLTPLKRSVLVKRQAAERLPAYMIPRRFIVVEAFPLNLSGKVDRQALAKRLQKDEPI